MVQVLIRRRNTHNSKEKTNALAVVFAAGRKKDTENILGCSRWQTMFLCSVE